MFKMSKEAKVWIKGIWKKPPFKYELDLYYLFFIVGALKEDRKKCNNLGDVIRDFPSDYTDSKRLIINLLLISEKNNRAIPDHDKERLRKEILEKYIDPNKNTLSDTGFSLFDEYAHAGYLHLQEKMAEPNEPGDFLMSYIDILKEIQKK